MFCVQKIDIKVVHLAGVALSRRRYVDGPEAGPDASTPPSLQKGTPPVRITNKSRKIDILFFLSFLLELEVDE